MKAGRFGRRVSAVAMLALAGVCAGRAQPLREAEPFRIGMVAPAGEGFSTVERAIARALGRKVEAVVTRGYAELAEAQIGRRVDYALYSTSAYAAASIRCGCLRPLVAPVRADGIAGVRSVLIVRQGAGDGPLTIASGPADSLATRLAPTALWQEAESARAQGRLIHAASAGEAEAMFLSGEVDGFFGWVPAGEDADAVLAGGSLARLQAAGIAEDGYAVGWVSPLLRRGPHAVRADMAPEEVAALLAALAASGTGLVEVSAEDYAAAVAALAVVNGLGAIE